MLLCLLCLKIDGTMIFLSLSLQLVILFQIYSFAVTPPNFKSFELDTFWNPAKTDIKILQVEYILSELALFAQQHQVGHIIMTGDLNALPGSAPIEYIKTGKIDSANKEKNRYFPSFSSTHSLDLTSAYEPLGEPVTNFTPQFQGCLDWIFFQKKAFILDQVLDNSELKFIGLPDPSHPSDHIPIGCDLYLNI